MQKYVDNKPYITGILHYLDKYYPAVETGKKRMERLFHEPGSDYLPMVYNGNVPERKTFPWFDRQELFYDIDKMTCEQFWLLMNAARSESDAQLTLRPNTGAGTAATVFGLEQEILPNDPPWLQQHLTKKQITEFVFPDDISSLGLMPFIKNIIAFYKEHLPNIPIYVADTQGPFDLAHLVYGDDIFTEMYDDPPFMKHLMELVTQAYIKVTEYLKELSGEPMQSCYHSMLYMPSGGIRVCEDTCTLLSPHLIDEFVVPYTNRVLEHFGGGWIHYCGRNDYLQNAILSQMPKCRILHLGNPDYHDMPKVIRNIKNADKAYYGSPIREKGQPLEDYFRSVLACLDGERRGFIFSSDISPEEAQNPRMVMDLYHRLQDEMLN